MYGYFYVIILKSLHGFCLKKNHTSRFLFMYIYIYLGIHFARVYNITSICRIRDIPLNSKASGAPWDFSRSSSAYFTISRVEYISPFPPTILGAFFQLECQIYQTKYKLLLWMKYYRVDKFNLFCIDILIMSTFRKLY